MLQPQTLVVSKSGTGGSRGNNNNNNTKFI